MRTIRISHELRLSSHAKTSFTDVFPLSMRSRGYALGGEVQDIHVGTLLWYCPKVRVSRFFFWNQSSYPLLLLSRFALIKWAFCRCFAENCKLMSAASATVFSSSGTAGCDGNLLVVFQFICGCRVAGWLHHIHRSLPSCRPSLSWRAPPGPVLGMGSEAAPPW